MFATLPLPGTHTPDKYYTSILFNLCPVLGRCISQVSFLCSNYGRVTSCKGHTVSISKSPPPLLSFPLPFLLAPCNSLLLLGKPSSRPVSSISCTRVFLSQNNHSLGSFVVNMTISKAECQIHSRLNSWPWPQSDAIQLPPHMDRAVRTTPCGDHQPWEETLEPLSFVAGEDRNHSVLQIEDEHLSYFP